jgi:hypothetical protein
LHRAVILPCRTAHSALPCHCRAVPCFSCGMPCTVPCRLAPRHAKHLATLSTSPRHLPRRARHLASSRQTRRRAMHLATPCTSPHQAPRHTTHLASPRQTSRNANEAPRHARDLASPRRSGDAYDYDRRDGARQLPLDHTNSEYPITLIGR